MIARAICLTLLLSQLVRAEGTPDLKRVRSSEDLARFIFSMTTNDAVLSVLLDGLNSTNSIKITSYTTAIPVREVYGTIVEERFGDELGKGFYAHEKKYEVRAICSFRDDKDEVWRFHITVFEERQYRLMRDLLKRKIHPSA
jgi:hypothetical protein